MTARRPQEALATLTFNPAVDVSAEVDRIEPERKLRCRDVRRDPGGGGVNVARVIRRLGGSALAVAAAGGPTGERLEAMLAREGVPVRIAPIAGETRESLTLFELASKQQFRFVLPGPRMTALETRRVSDEAAQAARGMYALVVSGSLPPGVSPDACGRLARRLRRQGVKLALDTSGPALKAGLAAGVWLVKPNLAELEELVGIRLDTDGARLQACRMVIASGGAQMVALSLGREGAMLVAAQKSWRAWPPPIEPASSVGAGDSFLAGLVWALARGESEAQALRWAMATAAATLLAPGTQLCRRADARRLAPAVRIESRGGLVVALRQAG